MLTHLRIQGLAIIDSLAIDFTPGFNVITGETGAGKSILILALNLLRGMKASPDALRAGSDQAVVAAHFEVPKGHRALLLLEELGIPRDEGGPMTVLVRRLINAKSRSQAWINDVPVTLSTLRDLAAALVDISGQHEDQKLLDPNEHVGYLDQFLGKAEIRAKVEAHYEACANGLREILGFLETLKTRRKDQDYLAFRCAELNRFDPSVADFAEVSSLCHRAESMLDNRDALKTAMALLDEGAGGDSLSKPLREVSRLLLHPKSGFEPMKALATDALELAAKIDDLSFQLGQQGSDCDIDERKLESAQNRLAGYQELFRKLDVTDADGLVAEHQRLEAEVGLLDSAMDELSAKLLQLSADAKQLKSSAKALSEARLTAKNTVIKRIEGELRDLAMAGARIDINLTPVKRALPALDLGGCDAATQDLWTEAAETLCGIGEHGSEKAQFLLAANRGEGAQAIQKVASGGELSRILLAFKRVLASQGEAGLLVFDEIDTGISGRVADVVGAKLKGLAEHFQVICISHLPQVAAYAQAHFKVQKLGRKARTEAQINRLSPQESAEEIARLLSGAEITTPSLANAQTLIERAQRSR